MANQCEVIEEQGFFTATPFPTFILTLQELGTVSDMLSSARMEVIGESLVASDAIIYSRGDVVFEVGHLTGVFTGVGQPSILVLESGRLSDRMVPTRSVAIIETGTVTDTPIFNRAAILYEIGQLVDTATPVRHFNVVIREAGTLKDTLSYRRGMVISETGTVGDAMFVSRSAVIAEVGTLVNLLLAAGQTFEVIRETGVLADLVTQVLQARMTVFEEGFVDGDAMADGDGAGWTANTDTWGASRYTSIGVNSIAVIDGVLHGAGPEGLFRLDANDDAGAPIAAGIDTGTSDLGSPNSKRMGYAYLGAQTDGALLFNVQSMQAGSRLVYAYPFENWAIDDGYAPTRAKLGKGIRSRYWQFGVRNKNGSNFIIEDLQVVYDLTGRKV